MTQAAEPVWARQDRESPPAFAAFEAYRDLGAGRSIDAVAARLAGRQKGAKRAPGRLRKWSVDHRWVERAAAFDDHLATVRRRRVEEATRRQADEWVRRREQWPEVEFGLALKLVDRATAVIDGPRVPAGQAPAPPAVTDSLDLRRAAAVLREASGLARAAIASAIGPEEPGGQFGGPAADPAGTAAADVLDRAAREMEQWRAEQRTKMFGWPTAPPGPDGAATSTA